MGNTKDFSMSPLNYVSKKLTVYTYNSHTHAKKTNKIWIKKNAGTIHTARKKERGGVQETKQGNSFVWSILNDSHFAPVHPCRLESVCLNIWTVSNSN